jgi:hypothetical protein
VGGGGGQRICCATDWKIANPNKIQTAMESHEMCAITAGTQSLLPASLTSTGVLKIKRKKKRKKKNENKHKQTKCDNYFWNYTYVPDQ